MAEIVGRLGEDDVLRGPDGESSGIYGDSRDELLGSQRGGDDQITAGGGADVWNSVYGDAFGMTETSVGGNDTILGGGDGALNWLHGDAEEMSGSAAGGNDRITGGSGANFNYLVGDGAMMSTGTSGGDDVLTGGDYAANRLHGDGVEVFGDIRAGDDILVGGRDGINILWGDGWEMSITGAAGSDRVQGGEGGRNDLSGDANWLSGGSGGNDLVIGGEGADNVLQGDARHLYSRGSNDTLIASDAGTNLLMGDAYQMNGRSIGGDDRLISGRGDDEMWGDAKFRSGISLFDDGTEEDWYANPPEVDDTVGGSDTFVFMRNNGNDVVHDFEQGRESIELWGFTEQVNTFKGSASAWDRMPDRAKANFLEEQPLSFERLSIEVVERDSVINFDGDNSLRMNGVDTLTAADFRFFDEHCPPELDLLT